MDTIEKFELRWGQELQSQIDTVNKKLDLIAPLFVEMIQALRANLLIIDQIISMSPDPKAAALLKWRNTTAELIKQVEEKMRT